MSKCAHPFSSRSSFLILLILFLQSCAPQQQSYKEAQDPGVGIGNDTMLAADGTMLPLRSWLPAGKPKAVIVALHGFNDYSKAFEGAGAFFKARGVAVYAYDQRGFGQAHYTGVWGNEKNFVSDLAQCVREVSRRWPSAPVYVLGESMGGAVTLVALADPAFPKVRGVILSAPAIWGGEAMNPFFHGTLWLAAHTIPQHEMSGSDLKITATNNTPMLWRMAYDPLIIKKTRIDTIYGIVRLMGDGYDAVPQIKTPVLLLYGKQDQVIPREPIESALKRFTAPVQFALYPDGYHMLMRDMQGEMVMDDILSWIEHPGAELPSGFGEKQKESP